MKGKSQDQNCCRLERENDVMVAEGMPGPFAVSYAVALNRGAAQSNASGGGDI
jgi:hypothetical protein